MLPASAALTYATVGVNYEDIDPIKVEGQEAAAGTASYVASDGLAECAWSRGESAFVMRLPNGGYLAVVLEGLGTKNRVADRMYKLTGRSFHDWVGEDNAAMSMNDLLTVGALPHVFGVKIDAGDSAWFKDEVRRRDFLRGCAEACRISRCTWGGGESAALRGVVFPETAVFSSMAVGYVENEEHLINPSAIHPGDAIVFLESSGPHANGYTLARAIAERKDPLLRRAGHWLLPKRFKLEALPKGYLTELPNGQPYGEALLQPTLQYSPVMRELRWRGIRVSYAINGTGHALRKLMRAKQPFTYVVDALPEPHPVFAFMQRAGNITDEEMYGTFNMGVGFILIVRAEDAAATIDAARSNGIGAILAGRVEEGPRKVIINPRKLVYDASTLAIR